MAEREVLRLTVYRFRVRWFEVLYELRKVNVVMVFKLKENGILIWVDILFLLGNVCNAINV
jgi:hypothetical protein